MRGGGGGGGRGGGGGGGGRPQQPQPRAAGEGAEIPPASRKLVQGLKGILADRTEVEIYATLLDCGMDPDVAVERLIAQDPFLEVRRKRSNKKEVKPSQETRPRPFYKSAYRGSKAGSDRSGRSYPGSGDSSASVKGPIKKETELLSPRNTSTADSAKGGNSVETISAAGNLADAKSTSFQPPQVQHGWGGVPGRPSLADIVKKGIPQAKSGGRPAANKAGMPAFGGSVVSNASNHNTVLRSEGDSVRAGKLPNGSIQVHPVPKDDSSVGILPPGQGSHVPEGIGAASTNVSTPRSFTLEVNEVGTNNLEQTKEMSASNTSGLTSSGPFSPSDKDLPLNTDLIEKTDGYLSDKHPFEHSQNVDSNGDMSATAYQLEHLTIHEETRPKASEDNPAVIIPDHLQVSNADFAHFTFGSFVSGTLDASCSTIPASNDVEVASASDNQSGDQSDVRIHEFENKETITPAANEYIASATNENPDITPVQQSEVGRADLLDVTNNTEYSLSSSDYATSNAVQPDSTTQTYLQENRQMQNISPLSSFMHGSMPNGLLPPAMPPFRELDPAFSMLLTNPPLATMIHGATPSPVSNSTVSSQPQENVNPGGLSNPQLAHSQGITNISPGPPLPHHLLNPYAQGGLPLGYASMIGYPSLPQSYAYLPPAAFQQQYMSNGLFHQGAAADPNSGLKYPMPQYKTNVPLASLPQPASLLSNYMGGYGTANGMPGNFALNQSSTQSATTSLGFDGSMPSQYKDGNHYVPLQQQSENPAMWMHGAGSRGMPPLGANSMYAYQGQQGHQGSFWQGQLPSQYGAALGQSQQGLGPEQIEEWTEGRGSPEAIKVLLEKESPSILKKDDLSIICKSWKISEDRVSTCWTPGSVRIYEDLVNEEKFKFPLHSFCVEILNYFKIPPGRIMKNGWLTIIKFIENCEKKKDVPSVEKYLKMYSLIVHKKLFCTMRKNREIIEENNSQEIEMTSRHGPNNWRCRYFYLKPKPNSLWEFPVEWGEEKPKKRVNQNVNSEPIRKGINSSKSEGTRILEVELASANKMCSSPTNKIKTLEIQLLSANEKLKVCSSANEKLKAICSMQNETIKMLEIQISSANENLKEQENISKCLQLRLTEVEQQNRDGERRRKKLHDTMLELKGNIRVWCRVRPLLPNEKEKNEEVAVSKSGENSLDLIHNAQSYTFVFDKVFDDLTTQVQVFDEVSELVQSAIDGYKVCIFAYGQSGSGKTHTMMGHPEVHDQKGVIPRAVEQIFQASQCPVSQGWIYNVQVSMLEIYNEIIKDLIHKPGMSVGLSVVDVQSIDEVYSLLDQVAKKRSVAKTGMNETSSRSHFVFIVQIVGENEETHQRVHGVLNLVDLAGSERLDKSGAIGDTLKETKAINKSLFHLTEVIAAIARKDAHISFRNSTLTQFLEPYLGGGSKTLMLVNLSPVVSSSEESICSLRFAQKVKKCETGLARRQQTYGEAPARQHEKTLAPFKTPARQAKEVIVHSLKPIVRSMKRQSVKRPSSSVRGGVPVKRPSSSVRGGVQLD